MSGDKVGPLPVIPGDILDDLGSRFVINVPDFERNDLTRICFQMELAHWFYLDYYTTSSDEAIAAATADTKKITMRDFTAIMFRHIKFLKKHANNVDKILEDWKEYKLAVPTFGAIILNENLSHVILVQGYYSKNSWGFPKGKINEDELPHNCAVREVWEETGFDISPYISEDDFIETVINFQTVRLYLIPGVSTNTKFEPRTRCEIKRVNWFPLVDLPTSKKDQIRNNLGVTHNGLYMVMPFIKNIRKWISDYLLHQQERKLGIISRKDSFNNNNEANTPKPVSSSKKKDRNANNKSRNSHKKSQTHFNTQNQGVVAEKMSFEDDEDNIFKPKAWVNFSIDKNSILSAISSSWA